MPLSGIVSVLFFKFCGRDAGFISFDLMTGTSASASVRTAVLVHCIWCLLTDWVPVGYSVINSSRRHYKWLLNRDGGCCIMWLMPDHPTGGKVN